MSLSVHNLAKDYPTRSGPLPVLRGVDLELARGDALAVMGPSGSGKSTLLHILGTLDDPTSGRVRLNGEDPFALSERQLAAVARALVMRPVLLLADEPTGNLDRTRAREIGTLLLDLHQEQRTILVVVTHSKDLADTFPRTLLMDDGRLHSTTEPTPT